MLVLSRKLNEKIVINGNIVVTIVKIDRNQVRIGIEAPGEVGVYREEILSGFPGRHEVEAPRSPSGLETRRRAGGQPPWKILDKSGRLD